MEDQQLVGLLANGSLTTALLVLIYRVGSALVAASKENTKAIGALREDIAEIRGEMMGAAGERRRLTPPVGSQQIPTSREARDRVVTPRVIPLRRPRTEPDSEG